MSKSCKFAFRYFYTPAEMQHSKSRWTLSYPMLSSVLGFGSKSCVISWKIFRGTLVRGWKKADEENPLTLILLWRAFQDGYITLESMVHFIQKTFPDLNLENAWSVANYVASSTISTWKEVIFHISTYFILDCYE